MDIAPEHVVARRVLLDALAALEGHLDSLILVGTQAVYHYTGDADLNVALLTTDADLAINAHDLAEAPEIGSVVRTAGFTPGPQPGPLGQCPRCGRGSHGDAASGGRHQGIDSPRSTGSI